jgi:hypothetical protein
MPLDVILAVTRGEQLSDGRLPSEREFNAAIAAAPHLHPGLSAAMIQADVTSSTAPMGAISVSRSLRTPAPRRFPPLTLPTFVIMLVNQLIRR